MERNDRLHGLISGMLRNRLFAGRIVLTRNDEERQFLEGWLAKRGGEETPHGEPVRRVIEECRRCGEIELKKMPAGSGANGVMLILNAPRLVNKAEKLLLKNEAGEMLKRIVSSMNLVLEECYITNVIKCDVKNPLAKPSTLLAKCNAILKMEVETVKPRMAVVFGDIIPLQKLIKESRGVQWFNVEHPITLIKNPELKRGAWSTLKLAMQEIVPDR
ncbi:MAG: hypothetical protein JXA20_09760 [Spirochaetes bacterium]|nr:hypothetical protein [Spirochaetota bacterium]